MSFLPRSSSFHLFKKHKPVSPEKNSRPGSFALGQEESAELIHMKTAHHVLEENRILKEEQNALQLELERSRLSECKLREEISKMAHDLITCRHADEIHAETNSSKDEEKKLERFVNDELNAECRSFKLQVSVLKKELASSKEKLIIVEDRLERNKSKKENTDEISDEQCVSISKTVLLTLIDKVKKHRRLMGYVTGCEMKDDVTIMDCQSAPSASYFQTTFEDSINSLLEDVCRCRNQLDEREKVFRVYSESYRRLEGSEQSLRKSEQTLTKDLDGCQRMLQEKSLHLKEEIFASRQLMEELEELRQSDGEKTAQIDVLEEERAMLKEVEACNRQLLEDSHRQQIATLQQQMQENDRRLRTELGVYKERLDRYEPSSI